MFISARMRLFLIPGLLFCLTGGDPLLANHRSVTSQPGSSGRREVEYISPEFALLELFVGTWSVTQNHLDADGGIIATAKGTERVIWVLDDHAIRRDYTSGAKPSIFKASGTMTWNEVEKKYNCVWFDNASTMGPSHAKASWDAETRTMTFFADSLGKDGSRVRHKVVEQFTDKERRVATTYLIEGYKSVKRMEMHYQRATPCPGILRPIFDDGLGRGGS